MEMIVGAPSSCMELDLYGVSDSFLLKMDDNNALLGSYPVDDECRIHVRRHFSGYLSCHRKLQNTLSVESSAVLLNPILLSGN